MKKIAFGIVAAAILATAVPAQAEVPAGTFIGAQTPDQYLAKDNLIGAKVYDGNGQIIGDIEDLIVNDMNQIIGVVMGTGGFAGLGEKKVGVHLSAFEFVDENGKTTIRLPQATKEVLTAVEPFQRATPQKSLLERAKEKAKELTDKSSVTAKDAYEKAKKDAGPALEEAQKAAKEAYEKGKAAAKEAYEKGKEAYEKAQEPSNTSGQTGAPAGQPGAPAEQPAAPAEPQKQ
jgi:sporulation protein YlmC with PRC-barrel domain